MVTFDPAKDAANTDKHGVSLSMAEEMDMTTAVIVADDRRAYGEDRFTAYGKIAGRMFALAFTVRDGEVRAISLRKANRREQRRFDR